MGQSDDDLLARLNALRPSPVTLHTNPAIDVVISQPKTAEDHLSDRLKKLRNGEAATDDPSTVVAPKTAPVPAPSAEYITDSDSHPWQMESHEQSVEELLAELEGNEQVKLDPGSQTDVQRLLQEARSMLPTDSQNVQADAESGPHDDQQDDKAPNSMTEEQEADEYVQKVLAELELAGTSDQKDLDATDAAKVDQGSQPSFALPSAPDTTASAEPLANEDSELEARFSKLGLGLPSTPDSTPVSKKSQKTTTKPGLPTFTDDDIDSWCVICNEDGEVRCLGCGNDIYCQTCWQEGHGNKPGQERGHKAVQYVRKGGGLAAAD